MFRLVVLSAIVCRGRRPTAYGTIPGDSFMPTNSSNVQLWRSKDYSVVAYSADELSCSF